MARKMYWGDNGEHEFWQSADGELLVLRNHPETRWIAFAPLVQPGTFATAAEAATSIGGDLQTGRVWKEVYPNTNRMELCDVD